MSKITDTCSTSESFSVGTNLERYRKHDPSSLEKIIPIQSVAIKESLEKLYIYHNDKIVEILSSFFNILVRLENGLMSGAFLHRCYLNHARKHFKTNALKCVIKNTSDFRLILNSLINEHQVKDFGVTKGWTVAVPL